MSVVAHKFARSSILVLALASIVPSTHAASVTVAAGDVFSLNNGYYSLTGSGALVYSSAKVGNDSLGGIIDTGIFPGLYSDVTGTSTSPVSSVTFDDVSGAIQLSSSIGGMYQVAKKNSLMTGGNLSVTNMTYDASIKTLYADVHGVSLAGGDQGLIKQMPFFTVNSATGASALTGTGTFTSVLSGLYLTSASMDYITKSLGLGGLASSVTKGTDFGVLTTTWTVVKSAGPVPVPEPSAWSLMALGLLSVFVARRRAVGSR